MKIGIKIVPETTPESLEEVIKVADYLEIYARPGEHFSYLPALLEQYKLPTTIHCAHSGDEINLSNPNCGDINKIALEHAITLADNFNSKYIVIHPGHLAHGACSIDHTISTINKYHDPRFVIESMPFLIGEKLSVGQLLCTNLEEIKTIVQQCNIGFCLDFNHSVGSAVHQNLDWEEFLKEHIEIGPNMYHISDVDITKGDEVHLNFFDGEIDLEKVRGMIPENAWVTLETPPDREKQLAEVNFLRL